MRQAKASPMEHARRTPLHKIGELPPDLFLGCISGVPSGLSALLIDKWSAQLSPKKHLPKKAYSH
ncbi:hypothetical protein D3C85_1684050 [compost metagenome]|jgi:hypothetical protein